MKRQAKLSKICSGFLALNVLIVAMLAASNPDEICLWAVGVTALIGSVVMWRSAKISAFAAWLTAAGMMTASIMMLSDDPFTDGNAGDPIGASVTAAYSMLYVAAAIELHLKWPSLKWT